MVFAPVHVDKKTGVIKPSLFSHAFEVGCSIQRYDWATDRELLEFVAGFLKGKEDRRWLGVVKANVAALREIRAPDSDARGMCVYDTAEQLNPAHGEFGVALPIQEEDRGEIRLAMMEKFQVGTLVAPSEYRGGVIFRSLPDELRRRCGPISLG